MKTPKKVTKFKFLMVRKTRKSKCAKNEPLLKRQEPRDYVENRESDCTEISLRIV